MRMMVLVIGILLAALSATAFAGGKRHIALQINNQTGHDFTSSNAEHQQVHVDRRGSDCKTVTPPDLQGDDNDCHDIDVQYDFANT